MARIQFLFFLAFVTIGICEKAKRKATIVNIQINRCPTDNYNPSTIPPPKLELGNETAVMSVFVVAEGPIKLHIKSSGDVFEQMDGVQFYNGTAGGFIFTRYYKAIQVVESSFLDFIITGEYIETTEYHLEISTTSRIITHHPFILVPVETDVITCGPPSDEVDTVTEEKTGKRVVISESNIPTVTVPDSYPTEEDILIGNVTVPSTAKIALVRLEMQRNKKSRIDSYFLKGPTNVINVTVSNIETGLAVFYIDGEGKDFSLSIKSLEKRKGMAPMVFPVKNGIASFKYYVQPSNQLIYDRWIARIVNNLGDVLYVYIKVSRDLI